MLCVDCPYVEYQTYINSDGSESWESICNRNSFECPFPENVEQLELEYIDSLLPF